MLEAFTGVASRQLYDPADGATLDNRTLSWLLREGVRIDDLASPIAVTAARILLQPGGRYHPCQGIGEFALIIPVPADPATLVTDLGAVDLIAWSPRSGRIGTRLGEVFGLGAEQVGVGGLGTTGLPIPVHRDPLGWLRSGRRGLVIADWQIAGLALSGLLLEAEDEHHRRDLLQMLTPRPPTVVVANRRAAA